MFLLINSFLKTEPTISNLYTVRKPRKMGSKSEKEKRVGNTTGVLERTDNRMSSSVPHYDTLPIK